MSDSYRIFETDEFLARVRRLDAADRQFLQRKLASQINPQIREEPHFGRNIKRLRGYDPPTWRYRAGHFRLFFAIDEDEGLVLLLTFSRRKDAYR